MRRVLLGALLVVISACGSSKDDNGDGIADGVLKPNDVSVIAPSTPKGGISGTVLDSDGAALAGASVALSLDGVASTSTDATGHFNFTGLPAGSSVGVTISKSGYTTASLITTIPSAAGNVPIDNGVAFVGPVHLFQAASKLDVTVVGYDGRDVAPSAILQVTPAFWTDSDYGSQTFGGSLVAKATAASGLIEFTNVPDLAELARLTGATGTLSIAVDPVDVDNDGRADYGGATLTITAAQALTNPGLLTVHLPPAAQGAGALQVIGSNCGGLTAAGASNGPAGSSIAAGDHLLISFNQPIIPSTLSLQVLDDTGLPISATPVVGATGSTVDISGAFPAGHALTVKLGAAPAGSQPVTEQQFGGTCFVQAQGATPVVSHVTYLGATSSTPLAPGGEVKVEFDSQLGNETTTPVMAVYLDSDLDGDGKRISQGETDGTGKTNSAGGFLVTIDPSKPTALNGHFSRFWHFYYSAGTANVTAQKTANFYMNDLTNTPSATSIEWVNGATLGSSDFKGPLTPVTSF